MRIIEDEELNSITRGILIRYGIDFTNYESSSLKRRFVRVMDKFEFDTVFDLWKRLLKEKDFIYRMIDEITVGLTEMFRNPDLWQLLKSDLIQTYHYKPELKIWHAGCSTGEEVYTMSILLHEESLLYKTKTVATDLNRQSVEFARKGCFSMDLLKTYGKNYSVYSNGQKLEKYYLKVNESEGQMSKILTNHVTFLNHNLTKDPIEQKFDIIFCRNVMIYFDEKLKLKVLQSFYDSLKDDGYFIIGYYDALPPDNNRLFKIFNPKAKIFRKAL